MRERNELFIPYSRRDSQRGGPRADMRIVAFFAVVLIALGLAGWLYLRQASEVTHLASAVRQQELKKEALRRELVILNAEVAMLGSLKRVLQEGVEMGYVLPDAANPAQSLTVSCPGCQALDASALGPGGAPTGILEEQPKGPWQELKDWLAGWLRPWSVAAP